MTKQVQLRDDVYALLKARRRRGESFSDVVQRLAKPKGDPFSIVGQRRIEPGYEAFLREARDAERKSWSRLQRRRRGRP